MPKDTDKKLGTVEAAKMIGVELHRLYCWERYGIVKPKYLQFRTRRFRRYSQNDINRAIFIKKLVDEEKYSLEGAIRKL